MKIFLFGLSIFVITTVSIISCKKHVPHKLPNKDEEQADTTSTDDKKDSLFWYPIQESKFVKENFSFKFDNKIVKGRLWVEVEDLSANVATVEVSIEEASVDGDYIGGTLTWAEIIDSGQFVGLDDTWTGAYNDMGQKLDAKWQDFVNLLVLAYRNSKHTASTNGWIFSFKNDPIIGTVEVHPR